MEKILFNGLSQKMKLVYFLLLFITTRAFSQSNTPLPNAWVTDGSGSVSGIANDTANKKVYIAGSFSKVFLPVKSLALLNNSTGAADLSFPKVNATGEIRVTVPDGNGGWYIGGNFNQVGGQTRNNLAQIDANGVVTAWNPNIGFPSGGSYRPIETIVVDGNTVYVGGYFTTVGGISRNHLAAIDKATGSATSWNPNVDGTVTAIAVTASTIFVGGNFSTIGGQTRNNLGGISKATGLPTSWAPAITSGGVPNVASLQVNGSLVYIGGGFNTINGLPRNNLGAVDVTAGSTDSWNPDVNGGVNGILISGGTLFAGGVFTSIGGQVRLRIASFDIATGSLNSWDPNISGGSVYGLTILNNNLYAGGNFSQVGASQRSGLASFNLSSGTLTSWAPSAGSGDVRSIATNGSSILIGGDFTQLNAQSRKRLACFNTNDGSLTPWNPSANSDVSSIALDDGVVYVAGGFTQVGGQLRNGIAAIDGSTGLANSWDPGVDGIIISLCAHNNIVYASGYFSTLGGQPRNGLGAVSISTGLATSWNPNPNDVVNNLAQYNNVLYAVGAFTTIGGQSRNRVAAFDLNTGAITGWNPNANNEVLTVAVGTNAIYVGGFFTTIAGQSRSRLAAFNINTGNLTSWNPGPDVGIKKIVPNGSTVYVSGFFSSIGGQSRSKLAALSASTGLANSWNPNPNDVVYATAVNADKIFVGGGFTAIGGNGTIKNFAIFDNCTGAPNLPGAIAQTGGAIKVCPGETRTYTIAAVAKASSYSWSVPSGVNILSGQGTTSIEVLFGATYAASDTVKVRAENGCGNSTYRTKVVSKGNAPATPAAITGENYGLCSQSGIAYSTTNVPDLTYAWSFSSANGTVASGQGTSAIMANYTPGAATSILSVTATNGCGTSNPRNKTIYAKPNKSAGITGSPAVCAHATNVAYSTDPVYGATSYTWKAPAGSHISDGTTTSTGNTLTTTATSVTVNFGTVGGNVSVSTSNACGTGGNLAKAVTMNCRLVNGVEEAIASENITVYPNPATDQVTVSFNTDRAGEYTIHLYDVIGKEVQTISGNTTEGMNQVDVNTSLLTSGVYHLVLKGQGLDYNTKLVLDK